jgi:hypothetical protein
MKKLLAILFVAVAVIGCGAGSAQALELTIGDIYYLGRIVDGTPAGESNEAAYVNYLKELAPLADVGPVSVDPLISGQYFTRSGNPFGYPSLPTAVFHFRYDPPPAGGSFTSTGFQYILGKYGQGETHVWYSQTGFTGTVVVPWLSSEQRGLSHITLLNPTTVPDGGATLMLLGGALVGLGALYRKFRA